jgi:hypothetical protein
MQSRSGSICCSAYEKDGEMESKRNMRFSPIHLCRGYLYRTRIRECQLETAPLLWDMHAAFLRREKNLHYLLLRATGHHETYHLFVNGRKVFPKLLTYLKAQGSCSPLSLMGTHFHPGFLLRRMAKMHWTARSANPPALRSKFAFSPLTTFEILAILIPLPGGRHMILLDRRPAIKQDPASRQKNEPMSSSKSRPERRASRQLEFRSTGFITSSRQKFPGQAPVFCEWRHYQARRPPARNPATRRP